ncbi:MAG: tetratricopeptide repeat-containing glycosyltransferase family protein [Pirellulales bacterium]
MTSEGSERKSDSSHVQVRDWLDELSGSGGARVQMDSAGACTGQIEMLLIEGNQAAAEGDRDKAASMYRQVLALDPRHVQAWNNLGVMFADSGAPERAIDHYRSALHYQGDFIDALYNLGNAYRELKRYDEALDCYDAVLSRRSTFAPAYTNRAVCRMNMGSSDAAIEDFHRALHLHSDSAEAWTGLGLALSHLARYGEANQATNRALALAPAMPEPHYNLALLELLHGHYEIGWQEYEWRFRLPGHSYPVTGHPAWNGESPAGRRFLLVAEQGLGDAIQFVRFAKLLEGQGADITLLCAESHRWLLSAVPGVHRCLARESADESSETSGIDFCLPLMSLGRFFAPDAENIPGSVPYIPIDAGEVMRRRAWMADRFGTDRLRIGIAWRGSPGYRWDCHRSIPLKHFEGLALIPGVQLFSFQKGPGCEELLHCGFPIEDLGSQLDNDGRSMMESAAAAQTMDLLISADTSLGHLGGALGVPTWIVLPLSPDWRWRCGGDRSAWYPSVRLFRQPRWQDWSGVFREVEAAIREFFPKKRVEP